MYIAESKFGDVFLFESKHQQKKTENFTYYNYIQLDCSFEDAYKNAEILKKTFLLIEKRTVKVVGDTIKEIEF